MTDFVTTLKLAEKAREDIYFEKVNRELIEALHQQQKTPRKEATAGPADGSSADTDKHA